ncbi:MAG: metallophosphoesterase [Desulfotomaculaceae bacterium]|nr:metallophosphoesterase [Desulfotomaculaceae bacterium]
MCLCFRGDIISIRKKLIIFAIIIFAVLILINIVLNNRLTVRYYELESNKINDYVRIAFVADLHSCYYGEDQIELLSCIDEQKPDLILFGGDIVDDVLPFENAAAALKSSAEKYPCYYVSGNHEYWSGKIGTIKQMISRYGIIILEGQSETVSINEQLVNVCGVDDAEIGERNFMQQIVKAEDQADPDLFTIFLAHRPEYIDTYLQYDFDLILSGHAHGGQWRIPGIINGLLAPNQGFFPKYAGGLYELRDKTFIVSRGLAKESTRIPRIFNPPELVIVDLVPVNTN